MLIKAVHVTERKSEGIFEVFLHKKEYIFRVHKRIENDIAEGMVTHFSKNQILYITKIINDCEDEKQYKQKIRTLRLVDPKKVRFVSEEELAEREKLRKEQEIERIRSTYVNVFKGTLLNYGDKQFSRTDVVREVVVTEATNKWVKVGDILYIYFKINDIYRYLLVEEILVGVPPTEAPLTREVVDHYYKKIEKGYAKRRIGLKGMPLKPKKKKADEKPDKQLKKPKPAKKEKEVKPVKPPKFNSAVYHPFVIRLRTEDD